MEIWKLASVFAILAVFVMGVAYADSDDVEAQVIVPSTCTISLDVTSFTWGSINAGADSTTLNKAVQVSNTGSDTAALTVKGEDWSDGGVLSFGVGNTEWSVTPATNYGSGTDLTTGDVSVNAALANGANDDIYFGVGVPASQDAATYNQTITLTLTC